MANAGRHGARPLPVLRAGVARIEMPLLAAGALLAFLVAILATGRRVAFPVSFLHIVFAAGAMPLIAGAMIYFTPVLTRSREPHAAVWLIPALALAAGLTAVAALAAERRLVVPAATLGLIAAAVLAGWMTWRARTALGRPHPCLEWYRLALACLMLGLLAAALTDTWPQQAAALRRFHLHVNTLGFIGMTALGTLRVLLPTAGRYADSEAGADLARWRHWVFAGTLLVAGGAAASWPVLAWLGLITWAVPTLKFVFGLATRHRRAVWGWHRASAALSLATLGWLAVLMAGGLHAAGINAPAITTGWFVTLFLLPLVTGAVSVLWPVWIGSGRAADADSHGLAARLARGSVVRVLAFFASGALFAAGFDAALYLAGAALALFLLQWLWAPLAAAARARRRQPG